MANKTHKSSGFSLIQMAIILTVIAVLMAAALPGGLETSGAAQKDITVKRLTAIQNAIRGYRAYNSFLPCPADGSLAITNANFGIQAANAGTCTGGTPAANFGPSGNVVAGMVPVRTLNLPYEYAFDGWGRRFTYVVDARVTGGAGAGSTLLVTQSVEEMYSGSTNVAFGNISVAGTITAGQTVWVTGAVTYMGIDASNINGARVVLNLTGPTAVNGFTITAGAAATGSSGLGGQTIRIYNYDYYCNSLTTTGAPYAITISGDTSTTAMMAIISHGKNGHGAFPGQGSSIANRINVGTTDTAELENASVNSAFTTSFNATFYKKVETSTFDDIVVYSQKCKN